MAVTVETDLFRIPSRGEILVNGLPYKTGNEHKTLDLLQRNDRSLEDSLGYAQAKRRVGMSIFATMLAGTVINYIFYRAFGTYPPLPAIEIVSEIIYLATAVGGIKMVQNGNKELRPIQAELQLRRSAK